ALRASFPADGPVEEGWAHRPSLSPLDTYGEGAWDASLWFTGDGRNFEPILRANRLSDPILPRNQTVLIPASLLLDPFRAAWARRPGPVALARGAPAPGEARPSATGRGSAPRGVAPWLEGGAPKVREGRLDAHEDRLDPREDRLDAQADRPDV